MNTINNDLEDPKADLLDEDDVNGDLKTNEIIERRKHKTSQKIDITDLKKVVMECLTETGVVHESEIKGNDPVALSKDNQDSITDILSELVALSKDIVFLAEKYTLLSERTIRALKRLSTLEDAGEHREVLIEAIEARDKLKLEADRVAIELKGENRDKFWGNIKWIILAIVAIISVLYGIFKP